MAKTKAKTLTVRVAVMYDGEGYFAAEAASLTQTSARLCACTRFPYSCIVEIELPIPEPAKPIKGKVLKVKAVKT